MRIGIVGPAERAAAWENHLRPHQSVSEVVLSESLDGIGSVHACLLLDDTNHHAQLMDAIKAGYHTFSISTLITDHALAEKIYHLSEEANVRVQFSHWPTLAPASQWIAQQIKNPSFIQINRELSHTSSLEKNISFNELWIDDLAYCLKYINGAVHHIDVSTSKLQSAAAHAMHMTLRFESAATASMFISRCASSGRHRRLISDHSQVFDCDAEEQSVRIGRENSSGNLYFKKKTFDGTTAAEQAVTQFLKSIQLKKPTLYNSYDLLQLTTLIQKVKAHL
jgi:predicted dehydrogenase